MRDILERLKIERRLGLSLFIGALACIAIVQGLLFAASASNEVAQEPTSVVAVPR
ncbi:MAG: hypothetical protein QGD90_08695 [Candidatus Hydrogenedentes bacterium]|nr:hypothetical protein [Candidatus Hydrogenedentota bacterium]